MNDSTLLEEISKPEYIQFRINQDYEAIANALNLRLDIPNSEERSEVPKQLSIIDLFQVITLVEAGNIYTLPGFKADIDHALLTNNRANLQALLVVAQAKLNFSDQSIQNLQNLFSQTEPDPNWQSTIKDSSKAEKLGLGLVTPSDVQRLLNKVLQ